MELTDIEKTTLQIFASEAGGYEVVSKLYKNYIERRKDTFIRNNLTDTVHTSQELGEKVKIFGEALSLVDGLFREIAQYRKPPDKLNEKNPAR